MVGRFELIAAGADDRGTLENLFQLYIHDFSEFWWDMAQGELGEDGLFEPYPLDPYWREPGRIPLIIRHDGHLAGFALLNQVGHLGAPVDRNMAEFFVVRKHRRSGLGLAAAQAIFSRYPGRWETAVARRNVAALAFWRRAISGHPHVLDLEEHDVQPPAWNGPLFTFRIA